MKGLGTEAAKLRRETVALARHDLDFLQTNALDSRLRQWTAEGTFALSEGEPVRLAILGSSTTTHLHAGIRVAGLRRDMPIATYESAYGQYLQELSDPTSGLHRFRPQVVLLALDAHHLTSGLAPSATQEDQTVAVDAVTDRLLHCWRSARAAFGAQVIQQSVLPCLPTLLGDNEQRLFGSRAGMIDRLNGRLRELADIEGVDLLAIDRRATIDGLDAWYDVTLWHRTKQEVSPSATPLYGDLVARLVAARRGLSSKVLVLDLDNTLWGGVVGDDGLAGIVVGQGSGEGESHLALQSYARALSARGVVLAVCSKNDPDNAREPFEAHPEMILRLDDIASFKANWDDKATNLRAIAADLNVGLDSLVFVDDNRFERELVRRELPMVAVPEFPDDPAEVPRRLADAGYFDGVAVTADDRARKDQYRENRLRDELRRTTVDLDGYLAALDMRLEWRAVEDVDLERAVQLVNKTNQFNLTTRRLSGDEMRTLMCTFGVFVLQFRLVDRFGDNGIIAIVIGEPSDDAGTARLTNWLMSCRILGRGVERAVLDVVAMVAREAGYSRLRGEYRRSAKNAMVADFYPKIGFVPVGDREDDNTRFDLDLGDHVPSTGPIVVHEVTK